VKNETSSNKEFADNFFMKANAAYWQFVSFELSISEYKKTPVKKYQGKSRNHDASLYENLIIYS